MERDIKLTNTELSLIFKGMSHILGNQEQIMRKLNVGEPYIVNDTNELSVQFGKLAKAYYKKDHPDWVDDTEGPDIV